MQGGPESRTLGVLVEGENEMRVLAGVLMLTTMALGATGARAQSGWSDELGIEIGQAERCEVAYLSHVVERDVDGKKLVMAKVHCVDQRVFDAMRPDEFEPFRFNACQPDTSQTC